MSNLQNCTALYRIALYCGSRSSQHIAVARTVQSVVEILKHNITSVLHLQHLRFTPFFLAFDKLLWCSTLQTKLLTAFRWPALWARRGLNHLDELSQSNYSIHVITWHNINRRIIIKLLYNAKSIVLNVLAISTELLQQPISINVQRFRGITPLSIVNNFLRTWSSFF